MTEPQLIFLHQGAFRKGRLVDYTESKYIGSDIKGNCVLEGDDISPLALHLVYATSLSPRLLKETQPAIDDNSFIMPKRKENVQPETGRDFRSKALHIGGLVHGIVDEAMHVAKNCGTPYFSVNAVEASTEPLDMNAPLREEVQSMFLHLNVPQSRPERTVQYTLHPTVQLYVPR